jgi:3-oxoacyl-[acyl-carrier protein] reductase
MANDSKLVVVTGATRGLGLAITSKLLAEKYRVVGIARKESAEFSLLKETYAGFLDYVEFDLTNTKDIHALSQQLMKKFGRIYGLVNNAGIGLDGILTTMHESDIEIMLRVNLHAPILLIKYLTRGMLINRSGRVINISSIIATTGYNGLVVYAATKAGLIGMSRSLARELGKGNVTVNCILPGYMETEMTSALGGIKLDSIRRRCALERFPSLTEVSSAVIYLMSPDASAITGTVLTVDAGSSA